MIESQSGKARQVNAGLQLKTAARLVAQELQLVLAAVRLLVDTKGWAHGEFPMDAWQEHKGVLAREVSLDDWFALELALASVRGFQQFHAVPRPSSDASDDIAALGKPFLRDIQPGYDALKNTCLTHRSCLALYLRKHVKAWGFRWLKSVKFGQT